MALTGNTRFANVLLLMVPFGLSSGFITIALGPFLKEAGLPMAEVAAITAATSIPHMLKFLWAPVVDMTLTRKTWYVIGALVSAGSYFGLTMLPVEGHVGLFTWLVIGQAVGATLVGMALEALLAHATGANEKGRAAGWAMGGNTGGNAVGGAIGLWLIDHVSPWQTGAIMASITLACGLGLIFVADVRSPKRGALLEAIRILLRDLWGMLSSRQGIVGIVMFTAPMGTGAIAFSAMAADWSVSHAQIELVNGWAAAVIVTVGCLLGGLASDRMDRAFAYVWSCVAMVIVTIAMALSPHTPTMYVVFVLAYMFTVGLAFGSYGGFVLAAAGTGAVATKYNILSSFANAPIWYMTRLDGHAYDAWSADGLLWFDALCGVGGCLLVTALILWFRARARRATAVAAA
jgi:MFS family permease